MPELSSAKSETRKKVSSTINNKDKRLVVIRKLKRFLDIQFSKKTLVR